MLILLYHIVHFNVNGFDRVCYLWSAALSTMPSFHDVFVCWESPVTPKAVILARRLSIGLLYLIAQHFVCGYKYITLSSTGIINKSAFLILCHFMSHNVPRHSTNSAYSPWNRSLSCMRRAWLPKPMHIYKVALSCFALFKFASLVLTF